ncbi:MAG: glycosyltransferase [Candidatus Marinimicrobia bacterium]|nr:glycosyltransferase [Candidatus Neomarinimicrobiota bacterium]
MNQKLPLVSVIVVNFNGLRFLEACFDSLDKTTYPNRELLLVDNGSRDESVSFMESHHPDVRIIRSATNLGFSGGNNLGLSQARGKYVVLLNNDTTVEPGWLEPLVNEMESDPQVAACQPKLLNLRKPTEFEYAGAAGGFIDRYGYPFLRGRIFDTIEDDRGQYNNPVDLFWTTGAAMAARRDVVAELGGLDEDFVLHMEEIDLCWRMHLQGKRLRFCPDSVVYHYGGGTLGSEDLAKMYYNHRNNIFMMLKNYAAGNLFKVLPVRFFWDLVLVLKSLVTLDLKRAAAVLGAYGWLMVHPRLILGKRRTIQRNRQVDDRQITPLIYPGSVVAAYYLRRKKRFPDLWPGAYRESSSHNQQG